MPRSKNKGPSLRLLRVNESLRHALSDILMKEDLHDPVLAEASITVAEVRCSPDLRNATAYVMPLGGENLDDILKALNKISPYLSGLVGRSVHMKYSPKLKFAVDTTFDESGKIDELLADPRVARDLGQED